MEQEDKLNELIQNAEDFIGTQKQLVKLHTIEKAGLAASSLASSLIVFSFFLLMFLFLSIALAYFLSEVFGRLYAGFAAVGILYLIIGLFLYSKKESLLQTPILNSIIKNMLKNE